MHNRTKSTGEEENSVVPMREDRGGKDGNNTSGVILGLGNFTNNPRLPFGRLDINKKAGTGGPPGNAGGGGRKSKPSAAWKKKPVGSRGGGAVASVIRKSPNATVPSEHALSNSRSNSNSNNPSPLNGFSAPSRLRGEISCLDPDLPPVFRPRTSADLQSSFWAGSNGEGGGIPSLKRASPIYDADGEDSDDDHIVGLCCSESPTKRTRSSSQQQQQHQTAYFHPESLWNLPPSVTPSHVDIAAEGCFDFSNNEGMVMTENLCWSSAVRESVVDGSFKLTLE